MELAQESLTHAAIPGTYVIDGTTYQVGLSSARQPEQQTPARTVATDARAYLAFTRK